MGDEKAKRRAELLRQRPRRSTRRGCGGRKTDRRARARARARSARASSYSPTVVRIGRRPAGGVSMIEMSRSPESDMCRVRGSAGPRARARRPRQRAYEPFCATPKRCSSSRITSPSSFGITSRERIRGPDQHLHLSVAELVEDARLVGARAEAGQSSRRVRKVAVALAESVPVLLGEDRRRAENEVCFPFRAAANAARTATSVLPKPTSPQTSRSIGRGASRSSLTASIARIWSSVSW